MCIASYWQGERYEVPITNLEPTTGTVSSVVNLHGRQETLWNSRPVDIITNEGSEFAYIYSYGYI